MSLKNSQYDILMREYNRRQLANLHQQKKNVEHAYQIAPQLEQISSELNSLSAQRARHSILGEQENANALRNRISFLKQQRLTILSDHGLPADYMELHYQCPDCKDTGYIGNKKCHCFQQAAVNLLYDQSNLKEILQRENFSTFSFRYYSTEYNQSLKRSVRDYMKDILNRCKAYVSSFQKQHGSILFTGNTGVGKTFLSNCIAKELIEQTSSVVYLTATELFEIFSRSSFSYSEEASDDVDHYILESDLLIIDDLGTERTNSFTNSKLFYCINERLNRQKGTIISTNLSPGDIRDMYSERIASRILSNYDIITLFGNDIRIQKKFGRR